MARAEPRLAASLAERQSERVGLTYGLAAYLWWGLVPLYFKAVMHVSAFEVLAHRVVWSLLLLTTLLVVTRRLREIARALGDRRVLRPLAVSTLLIALNWLVYIWAVGHGRVLEASLGYYINPLVNVALGYAFLGERLRRPQLLSIALAVSGVVYLTAQLEAPPWIALVLAVSFGVYGLIRKTARVDSLLGLCLETLLLAPLACAYLALAPNRAFFSGSMQTDVLLAFAGVVTAIPLLCFAAAARRLRLTTVGVLQYLSPSVQFGLAVLVFGEALTPAHVVTFACIWLALAIYSADALRGRRA